MTREEAIDLLDNLIGMVDDNHNSDYDTALQIAIQALEQTKWIPVSEEKTPILEKSNFDEKQYRFDLVCAYECGRNSIAENLKALEQEPKWIPYDGDDDTTWPKDGTWNIFTDGKHCSVERFKVDALNHFYPNGRLFELDDVIAWIPLPKPYKAESDDKEGGGLDETGREDHETDKPV